MKSVTVLTNPAAGGGHAHDAAAAAIARLRERGIAVTEIEGTSADDALRLARRAVADGTDALVTVGGDGLISIAWQALAQSGTPLGIVPAGTGNDHARLFGVPVDDPVAAADVIARGTVQTIDLARVGERWFGTVLSSGFDSLVTDRANRLRWPRGPMRYNVAMVAELAQLRPIHYRITLDDNEIDIDVAMVTVGNGTSYGGGMLVTPNASVTDGLLDLTVVEAGSRLRLVRLFPTVYKGTHVHLPDVHTFRSRRVRLAAAGITAYADGEPVAPLPIDIEAVPAAGRVLVATPAH